jgi:DNA-binding transcriptional MocR family regulator
MPHGVRWTEPRGGFSTWLELPPPLTARQIAADAARAGVVVTPGSRFCPDGSGQRALRVAFGATPPQAIEHGVRELARAIRHRLPRPGVLR